MEYSELLCNILENVGTLNITNVIAPHLWMFHFPVA